ncbi:hypothetical protein [Sphingomonas sp. UYP23]
MSELDEDSASAPKSNDSTLNVVTSAPGGGAEGFRMSSKSEQAPIANDVTVSKGDSLMLNAELRKRDQALELITQELHDLRHKLSFAENRLRQHDEEVEQYRKTLEGMTSVENQVAQWRAKFETERDWVFELSRQRRQSEEEVARLAAAVAHLEAEARSHSTRVQNFRLELAGLKADSARSAQSARIEYEATIEKAHDAKLLAERQIADLAARLEEKSSAQSPAPENERQQVEITRLSDLVKDRDKQIFDLRRRESEAMLEKRADDQKTRSRFEEIKKSVKDRDDQIFDLRKRESELLLEKKANEQKARERFEEISKLSSLLMQREAELLDKEWLHKVCVYFLKIPFWWYLLPASWRRKQRDRKLKQLAIFDARAYAERYPDVANERIDPFKHYVLHGLREHRDRVFN